MHRLLLVDDDRNTLNALTSVFTGRPEYVVESFTSAKMALRQARRQSYELVLCDRLMDEMSGIEFLEQMQSLQPEAIRILMSEQDDAELLQQAINDVHIFSYIRKPYVTDTVLHTVEHALEQHQKCMGLQNMRRMLMEQREIIQYQANILRQLEASQPGMMERYLLDAVFS